MSFFLNQTEQYHKNDLNDLMWEVTVCNSIETESSHLKQILVKNCTYGEQLFDYLFHLIPKKHCNKVMEVGGGYGFLMRDLLRNAQGMRNAQGIKSTMVDISPTMMAFQRQTLDGFHIRYLQSDFFDIDPEEIQGQDLVIMNEIVGDFPTACKMTKNMVVQGNHDNESLKGIQGNHDNESQKGIKGNHDNESQKGIKGNHDNVYFDKIREYVKQGIITLPEDEPFNLNIGAMIALDRVCSCNVPYIFLSEHSCEAKVTDHMSTHIKLMPSGNPEEIRLIGHSEYTIRFSDLESIARSHGYTVIRGNYTDFIKVDFSNRVNRIFKSNSQKDTYEIIRHFIGDLYIYEYLLLIQDPVIET